MPDAPVAAMPLIRPISDLRTNLNEVCDLARDTREALIMTKNGKPALVVFDSDAYEEKLAHDRYVAKLREAEIEAQYVQGTVSQEQLDAKMSELFARWDV